jgi:hypothetical protein
LCTAVFAWPFDLQPGGRLGLDLRLPVDDYRDAADLAEVRAPAADDLEAANRAFWTGKLDGSGLQVALPAPVAHLFDLFRLCRATLLILADDGEIHPGPTILVLLGTWKVLGAVALLVPRRALLKEWAYAGAFFTYTGAIVSHLTTGYDLNELRLLIVLTALTVLSWALRPPSRRT